VYGQGFASQFVPGLQLGGTSGKHADGTKFKYGAGLAIMELDALKNKFYINVNASDFYYRVTTLNRRAKMLRDSSKLAKNNGQMFGMRLGYTFGKEAATRYGFFVGGSYSDINATQSYDYGAFGGGLMFYKKLGKKLHAMAKVGYEVMKGKKYTVKGRTMLFEATVAYEFYQKFGISVQPAFYGRKFDFTGPVPSTGGTGAAYVGTKATQFFR
jgi:hypothetical protein